MEQQIPLKMNPTISQALMLDIHEVLCNDGDLKCSASKLVNWDFKQRFCKDLNPTFWNDINHSEMMIASTYLDVCLTLPRGVDYLLQDPHKFFMDISDLAITDWLLKSSSKHIRFLKAMEHPFLKWVEYYTKEFELLPFKEFHEFLPMKYLFMVALKEIIHNHEYPDTLDLKQDYLAVSELWLGFEKF